MRITILNFLAVATILAPAFTAASRAADPVDIGSRRELFVDHHLVDKIDGDAELTLSRPKDEGICIRFDKPWEGRFCGYITVIKVADEDYRLFYRGVPKSGGDGNSAEKTCTAVSNDGINWTKPNLGIHKDFGTEENNVILADCAPYTHNFSPMLDTRPGVPKEQRFKALGGTWKSGLIAFVSEDGFHWKKLQENKPVIHDEKAAALDSQNVSFWSDAEQCYVCYLRSWSKKPWGGFRWIARTTSKDYVNWTPIKDMEFLHDGKLAPKEHLYINQTSPYFRAPHIYIGTAARFMPGRRVLSDAQAKAINVDPSYFADISDGVLLTSRGGLTYQRTFMEGFIRPGIGYQNWVSRTNYPSLNIVQTGKDRMSCYVNNNYGQPTNCLRRYSMRLDGFASVRAGYDGGSLLTKPLVFSGKNLAINFATSAAGGIKVQIESPDGKPLEGYTFADCQELIGNEIDRVVVWKGKSDLESLAGKPVRLRFQLKDADVYALQFVKTP